MKMKDVSNMKNGQKIKRDKFQKQNLKMLVNSAIKIKITMIIL